MTMKYTQENLSNIACQLTSSDVVVTMGRAGRTGFTVFGPGTVNGLPNKFVIEIDKRLEGADLIERMTAACAAVRYGTQKATGLVTLSKGKAGQEAMASMTAFVNSMEYGFCEEISNCGWRAVQKVQRAAKPKANTVTVEINGARVSLPLSAIRQNDDGGFEFSIDVDLQSLADAIAVRDENARIDEEQREARQAGLDAADQGVGVLTAVA